MTRVHPALFVLSSAVFVGGLALSGCTSAVINPPEINPLVVRLADRAKPPESKIIRFKDALGAVSVEDNSSLDDSSRDASKARSMLAAFDYCDREQRFAFVTPPMNYSPHVNYSHVSTYSLRFSAEAESDLGESKTYVAPFECIEQKHSVKTGLLESEDVPANALHHALKDSRGGVIVHRAQTQSNFRENDIVVSVGAFRVESRGELAKAVDASPLGSITFGVVRDGKLIQIAGNVIDTTSAVTANAKQLLGALCKETGSAARACAKI